MCSRGVHPKTSATRPSPTAWLPLEILEMIIAHLVYDVPSLLACSLTCYSWRVVVAPHLLQTLTIMTSRWKNMRFVWPEPLEHMHRLGLLPSVRKLQVHESYGTFHGPEFTPKRFDSRTLHRFFALTNVQDLEIDYLDIHKLTLRARRYFKNFLPTLRSLSLKEPKGSRRQLLYFIGLFQYLEDLTLRYRYHKLRPEPKRDPTLTPLFAPPLRGRLRMTSTSSVDLLKDMVHLFGGIRFRYLDLFNVEGVWLWIDACAETLETLRLYPTSEQSPPPGRCAS